MTKPSCVEDPRLSAWIDGELGDADSAAVERHVGDCPACRELTEGLKAIAWPPAEADPGFIVRFRRERDAEAAFLGWTWRQLALRLLPVAAAALVAALATVWASAPRPAVVDPFEAVERQALGDPVAFGPGPSSALEIAFSPLPGEDR